MVAEVFAGIAGLKSVMDVLKGFKDINDANTRNAVAVDLQQKILAAYQSQTELAEQVRNLEKEIAKFKNWEAEKDRYVLTDYGSGSFAYSLKLEKANGEPMHKICANCYAKDQKSILQFRHTTADKRECVICNNCGKEAFLGTPQKLQATAIRSSGRPGDWMV